MTHDSSMTHEAKVQQLLEEVHVNGGTLEEVCRDHPELLEEVRRRSQRIRTIEERVESLFPSSGATRAHPGSLFSDVELPRIPGYEVQSLLGHGGMGVVYKAQHLALNRPVALKMVLAGAYASAPERQRLLREAQAVAGLRHPNIVTVYDVGECDGKPFFTMELVEGTDLAQRLAGTPQPAREAATTVETLANAVHSAHQAGIVHRDLKPANVLVMSDGAPKITDFGLARHFDGEATLTLTGLQVGTPSYMAPEQMRGGAEALGPNVDIYSLGALLYETLTGRPPFRAETALETQRQVIEDEPAPPSRLNSKIPRDLETICLKCLEKDHRRRYATALELAQDLGRFKRGETISARRTGPAVRVLKWARRHPAHAGAWAGGVMALGAVLGAILWTLSIRAAMTQAVSEDLADVRRLELASDWRAARNTLERAKTRLKAASSRDWLVQRVAETERDLDLVDHLAAMRFERAASREVEFDRGTWWDVYRTALTKASLLADGDTSEMFAARVAQSPARMAIVGALDDMADCAANGGDLEWLFKATRLADPDPWRDKARDKAVWSDPDALATLAREASVTSQPVPLLLNLTARLRVEEAESLIRRVQAAHPSDFWANFAMAEALDLRKDADAIGYHRAAIALRPEATAEHINLAIALANQNRFDEAIESMSRAVSLDPRSWVARYNLAAWLLRQHRIEEAIEHARIATQIDHPKQSLAHRVLGRALGQLGNYCEAAECFRRALDSCPDDEQLRAFLARALSECNAASKGTPTQPGP